MSRPFQILAMPGLVNEIRKQGAVAKLQGDHVVGYATLAQLRQAVQNVRVAKAQTLEPRTTGAKKD